MLKYFYLLLAFLVSSEAFHACKPLDHPVLHKLSSNKKDISSEGYGPIGSLIRQGPVPFFIRLAKPDTYEAAVKKYMLQEKCDRATAQGNMDAYFQDPNGWAINKLRERKTGIKIDYVNGNTDPKSLVLTAIWSVGIIGLFYRIFAVQVLGQ